MHGLGFYDTLFGKFMDSFTKKIHPITTITKEGVLYLATPRLLQYTREYFGCADAFGVPVILSSKYIDGRLRTSRPEEHSLGETSLF